ncbi:MAG: hypothetical protein FJ403_06560 [Verrucomicrobia bacterium]|nr:hypothetical protein [Verrucomicrobiota bacterium]
MTDTTPEFSGINRYRITVLLVDDQGIIGEAVRRMLAGESDLDFHYCGRSTEALNYANQFKPTVMNNFAELSGIKEPISISN